MRIILFTGKGGVGKTSIAAATAVRLASEGKKVFIMSTDQAHSLSDSFDQKIGSETVALRENLDALEIDAPLEMEKSWGKMQKYLLRLVASTQLTELEAQEMLVFPGVEELFSLLKIKEIYDENQYDVCIVDCAPTGETMSLLKFPEMFAWWMVKLMPIKRKAIKTVGSVIEKTTKIAMPDEEVFDELEELMQKLQDLQELMCRKDVVSLRIVTTPEKIVIKEAKRNFSYLHLYNYNVDAIIVNKIYPEESMQGYFEQWKKIQQDALQDVKDSFHEIPCFYYQLQKSELRTVEALRKAGEELYKEMHPEEVFFQESIFEVNKQENGYVMTLHLPFVKKEETTISQIGDELDIAINNEHRRFVLPKKLLGKEVMKANFREDCLCLHFES